MKGHRFLHCLLELMILVTDEKESPKPTTSNCTQKCRAFLLSLRSFHAQKMLVVVLYDSCCAVADSDHVNDKPEKGTDENRDPRKDNTNDEPFNDWQLNGR